jgi:hypothetical protein
MIGNDSVLLDLVDDSFSTSPSDDASDEGSGGGGGGCFIVATSLDFTATTGLWVWVTIIFCSVIINFLPGDGFISFQRCYDKGDIIIGRRAMDIEPAVYASKSRFPKNNRWFR